MQMVGLFTLHQDQDKVLDLLAQNGELFVHYKGRVLYKIVQLPKNNVISATLPEATKLVNSDIPKTHTVVDDFDEEKLVREVAEKMKTPRPK
jgi:hypothetical protein